MKQKIDRVLRIAANVLLKFLHGALFLDMLLMFVLMIAQIFLRSVFGSSIRWTDELLRFLFIWMVFLGLPSAIYFNELTRFDLLEQKLSPKAAMVLRTVLDLVAIFILLIVIDGAMVLVSRQMTQMATTMRLRMGLVYAVLPFSAAAAILFLALNIYLRVTGAPELCRGGDAS